MAFGFLFASIILPRRSEGRTITNLLEQSLYTLIPITFASYVLPKPEILTVILPNVGRVEEIRKIIPLGEFDLNKILMLLVISIVYLIVSVLIFERRFEEARRKGWLKLV